MAPRRTHYKKGPREVATLEWKTGVLHELKQRGIPVYKMESDIGARNTSVAKMLRSKQDGTSAYVSAINKYLNRPPSEFTAKERELFAAVREILPEGYEALHNIVQLIKKKRTSI